MARFDLYPNLDSDSSSDYPYLLDVQSDLLDSLQSRVVVPIGRAERFRQVRLPPNLTPTLVIAGECCFMQTPMLAAYPAHLLQNPVCSLAEQQFTITAALDFLFQGF